MSDMKLRLQRGAALLIQLEQRRQETRSPRWGYDAEYLIVSEELRQLERDILADPGALSSQLVRVHQKRLTDGSRPESR